MNATLRPRCGRGVESVHPIAAWTTASRRGDPAEIFTEYYETGRWRRRSSASGPGSDPDQTAVVVSQLADVMRHLGVASLLDIPCGDFAWMSRVDLSEIDYTGADIVQPLIEENRRRYESEGVRFRRLDVLVDQLPSVDLVLCRDCLVHFSLADGLRSLRNLARSGSKYLLITTFPQRASNDDISTGRWRALNLERPPFGFPSPLLVIDEACSEGGGRYADKSLGLWHLSDIAQAD